MIPEISSLHDSEDMVSFNKPFSFFQTAYRVFQEAQQNAGETVERFYSIGDYTIKLKFAGPDLVPLITPALEHLEISAAPSALTIHLWDNESTKTAMPPPPWTLDDYSARGEIRDYNNDRFSTACNKGSGALSILDSKIDSALWWIRSTSNFPFYESGSPLLTIFHWWLKRHGKQVVHAGAVGTKDAGVLMVGKGGSGKSTTTIACLKSELFYAGDDYSILSSAPKPYVFSLYSSGKLNADHIINFPDLVPKISNAERTDIEKPLLFLNQYYPDKIIKGFPIKAIFLPRITGLPETTLTPATSALGLMALAPSTLFQLSYANQASFREIAQFTKQVPCYHLNLGTQIEKIPDVISKFLNDK
jgi:hypothetical protein